VCLEGRVASDWVEIRLGRSSPGAQPASRVDKTHGVAQRTPHHWQGTCALRRVAVVVRCATGSAKATEETRWSRDQQKPLARRNKNPLTAAHLVKWTASSSALGW
jgi:hypothetical protein